MQVDIIVINGASSSGKSTLARCLQATLPEPRLVFSVDDLIASMPPQGFADGSLLLFGDAGEVTVGPGWREIETSWFHGLAAIAANGTGIILDEVFLDGARGQQRVRALLDGLRIFWVGVTCDVEVAVAREIRRGDRPLGMARRQASVVHHDVEYDVVVDTSEATPAVCADLVVAGLMRTTSCNSTHQLSLGSVEW